MSKFYIENPRQVHGCFRCGELMGEIREDEVSSAYICDSCGEDGVITFQHALDIINDLYLRGMVDLAHDDDEIEFFEEDE